MLQQNGMPNITYSLARATTNHSLVAPLAMAGTRRTPPPVTPSLSAPDAGLACVAVSPCLGEQQPAALDHRGGAAQV
jgi:hypothetical protein